MAGSAAPVILLWGEDEFLLRDAAVAVLGEHPPEMPAEEWQPGATGDLATPSLFGEVRRLLVSDAQDLPAEAVAEIARYAESPSPEARLVLTVSVSSRAKGPQARLTKPLGDRVEVRRVAVDRKELPRWIVDRAKARGIRATQAGASALVGTVGEDPAVLDRSVEQVATAFPGDGLTPETVASQFRGLGERRIWDLCDAAFSRNGASAIRALAAMLAAGEEPLAILGGVAARLRDLLRVRSVAPGMSPADAARAAGLRFDWQVRRYREQAARFSEDDLTSLHGRVAEADRLLKQGGDGTVVLPMLVAAIVGG